MRESKRFQSYALTCGCVVQCYMVCIYIYYKRVSRTKTPKNCPKGCSFDLLWELTKTLPVPSIGAIQSRIVGSHKLQSHRSKSDPHQRACNLNPEHLALKRFECKSSESNKTVVLVIVIVMIPVMVTVLVILITIKQWQHC